MARRWMWMVGWCLAAALVAAPADGGIRMRVEGVVEGVDRSDPAAPVVTIRPRDSFTVKDPRLALRVVFSTTAAGCIDWTDPENLARAFVLSLTPGNLIRAEMPGARSQWGAAPVRPAGVHFLAAASETDFPGREKVADPLVSALQPRPPRIPVLIRLDPPPLREKTDGPPPEESLESRQKAVLSALPAGAFEMGAALESVPVITGTATLDAVKALAAHPLVTAIEMDAPMIPHGGESPAPTEE